MAANNYFFDNMEYYAVFREGKARMARWFLKKGCGHVFLLVKNEAFWYEIDGGIGVGVSRITKFSPDLNLPCEYSKLKGVFAVIKICDQQGIERKWFNTRPLIVGGLSCVSLLKYMTGTKSWFAWTPYQLYKKLKRKGIVDVRRRK